jgi:spermidine synthase
MSAPAPGGFGSPYVLRLAVLCLAAFSSGAGSLIYQVVWIRKVTGVTSATATATAIVVAAFMAGLACGAWLAGRRPVLFRRSLLVYAVAELAAAALALVSIPVIEASASALLAPLFGPGIPVIWVAYTAVVLFLMLPTTLLGMSLPLLIAHDELRERDSRFFVNLIYGTNTLGAVCGCLLAGFITIEQLGLRRSVWLGAAFAALAAFVVLPAALRADHAPARPAADAPIAIGRVFLLAAFLCGWVALAAEIVWTRLVALIVFNTVYAYTQVLVAVLAGIAAGGYLGLLFCRRAAREASRPRLVGVAIIALTLGAVLTVAVPYALTSAPLVVQHLPELAQGNSLRAILTLGVVLAPPAAAIAFVLPLLALIASDHHRFQSFGDLYALNTWGGVAGSLIAGLVLLPWLGLDHSVLLLGLTGLAAAAILCLTQPRPFLPALTIAGGLSGVIGLSMSTNLPQDIYRLKIGPAASLLDFRETALSDAMVIGNANGERQLWINSAWVAATGGGHLSLGHLPAMFLQQRQRALGIGMGTGQTFAAVLEMGVQSLDCVEINRGVIELAEKWFSESNNDLTRRPEVRVYHDDGRAFLRTTSSRYDLIILEPLQSWSAGTTQLYTKEFYQEARRRMTDQAILAQWIPFYGQAPEATRSMVATALAVFPDATFWLDYQDGILILHRDEAAPRSWAPLAHQFRQFVASKGPMGRLETADDLLALFQMGPAALARWTEGARILTDDQPFLEFAAARGVGQDYFPDTLRAMQAFLEDPATYFDHATTDATIFANARLIRSTAQRSDLTEGVPRYARHLSELEAALAQVPTSSLLRTRYRLGVTGTLPAISSPAEVEKLLLRAIEADPDFAEAMYALAVLYTSQNRAADAARMEARALANPRVREALRKRRAGAGSAR